MNIATEPWIPIVWHDGRPDLVSLTEAFSQGHDIPDLALRPHERIAVMRLLICIVQAALDGPADYDHWQTCRPRIAPAARDYLKRWHDAFELFGSGRRFLQLDKVKKGTKKSGSEEAEGNCSSKLDLALATGNNSTLFDNAGGSERDFAPAQLALNLLTFQCFSPGGRIGVALCDGKETPGSGSSNHAPCISGGMLHALLRGKDLVESIHRNLMTKRQAEQFFGENCWGRPAWEHMPRGLADASALQNANRTYLGRLVPLSRAIFLAEDGHSLILANGLDYASYPEWREPTATVVTRKVKDQPVRVVLPASIERAAWRELHALAVKSVSQRTNGGPAALQNVTEEEAFDLWVGGLVASKAKLVDTTESVFHIPAAMITEPSQQAYEQGVRLAESTGSRLAQAVAAFHRELGDNLDRPELRARRWQILSKATTQFWTDVEHDLSDLLEVAAAPDRVGLEPAWHKTVWGKSVRRAARGAYEYACSHGDTPSNARVCPRAQRVGCRPDQTTRSRTRTGDWIMSNSHREPRETASRLLAHLRRLSNDRGAMADLRRALIPAQRHRAWPLLARCGGIDEARFETVAGLFAHHPDETSAGNLGTTCRQLSGQHSSFEGRFRRLLGCDRDNICEHIRPVVFAAAAKGIRINYEQLFIDLWYWSDKVKARWAMEYWGGPVDGGMPVAAEATP